MLPFDLVGYTFLIEALNASSLEEMLDGSYKDLIILKVLHVCFHADGILLTVDAEEKKTRQPRVEC